MDNVIILGVTSSLAAEVVSRLKDKKIYGFIRKEDETQLSQRRMYRQKDFVGVIDLIEYDSDLFKPLSSLVFLLKNSDRQFKVLNFLPNLPVRVLKFLREITRVEVLTIGSGAVVDWMKGKQDIVALSQINPDTKLFASYIEEKIRAEKLSTLTIHPGFFLPHETTPFTWSGLHLKTCWEIFAPVFDESLNWGKDKYVTPMDRLAVLIENWVIGKLNNPKKGGYAFGTQRSYSRWQLREFAGFIDVPGFIKLKYPPESEDYKFDMEETKRDLCDIPIDVRKTCIQARNWVELHASSLDAMFDNE